MPASTPPRFRKLDVRPILARGGEPLTAIQNQVAALEPGEGLLIVAPFLPAPLIERLRGEGFEARIERPSQSEWRIYFNRATTGNTTQE